MSMGRREFLTVLLSTSSLTHARNIVSDQPISSMKIDLSLDYPADIFHVDENNFLSFENYGSEFCFLFFNSERCMRKALDIKLLKRLDEAVIADAAKLQIPIVEANEICKTAGFPIRFKMINT